MTLPQPPHQFYAAGYHPHPFWAPDARRHWVATWDVICTAALSAVLLVMAAVAAWLSRFFAFAADKCPSDGCQPVPHHVDAFIYPVTWGGIGFALLIGAVGPFLSLWRRWRMFFWSLTAIGIVIASVVAGFAMTSYSARFWH